MKLKFFIALFISRCAYLALKILGYNATNFPGKVALKICPNFLCYVKKPKIIIGVTGTNGKTTVCNMIEDILKYNNYKITDNHQGGNTVHGIATTFLKNFKRKDVAVLEIDERSSKLIYKYVKPNYLIVTNLFRDSIKRNAHPFYILDIINSNVPDNTQLILNSDDLISSRVQNKKEPIFFGISKLKTDSKVQKNIVNDVLMCPKCNHKLKYDYFRYNHIGKASCTNCNFKSYDADYLITKINEKDIVVKYKNKEHSFNIVSNNIFNLYNELAVIVLLNELRFSERDIKESLENIQIVKSRLSFDKVNDIDLITFMSKGQNPVACSRVFSEVKNSKGTKEVILIMYDEKDNKYSSENICWIYDTDYEFLLDSSIKNIIIVGPRRKDEYLRLLFAGIKKSKLKMISEEEISETNFLRKDVDKIYIVNDIYAREVGIKVKSRIYEESK